MISIDVKALRERLGLSQAQFADRIGVKQATVSRWESGQPVPKPTMKLLAQMAISLDRAGPREAAE
jgi:transcriptional regulator with XRE-family HTH domain